MADNSHTKQNKNNNRNPTLRDHERAKGHSGHAFLGKVSATTGRDQVIEPGARTHVGGHTRVSSRDSGHN